MNIRSLHGGCHVVKGVKWAANHWFDALPHPSKPVVPAVSHTRIEDPDDFI